MLCRDIVIQRIVIIGGILDAVPGPSVRSVDHAHHPIDRLVIEHENVFPLFPRAIDAGLGEGDSHFRQPAGQRRAVHGIIHIIQVRFHHLKMSRMHITAPDPVPLRIVSRTVFGVYFVINVHQVVAVTLIKDLALVPGFLVNAEVCNRDPDHFARPGRDDAAAAFRCFRILRLEKGTESQRTHSGGYIFQEIPAADF